MMRLTRSPATFAVLLLAGACSSSLAPVNIGGVVARVDDGQLIVRNGTDRPVFTFAIGREVATRTDWIICADPDRCDPLASGATRRTPLSQIMGGDEPELQLSWWHGVATPNGWGWDSVRTAVVKTR
ncbi:MAG TPA: hypothetical protein VF761_15650 [Gemmatimonadaceae bacterium]